MHFATTADEVRVATDEALAEAEALVVAAIATGGRGTFATVLLPLDEADARIAAGYATGAFMARVHVDPAVRDAGQEAEERLDRWRVDLPFREDLAATIFAFAASPEAAGLEGEPRRLLDRLLRDLRRAGPRPGRSDPRGGAPPRGAPRGAVVRLPAEHRRVRGRPRPDA